jgi:hypothetical protein
MYKPIEGGSIVDIQGLKCNLPPEGYVWNRITNQLDFIGIYRRSNIDEDCYWEIPPLPVWYKEVVLKWDKYDKIKKDDDDDFYDERLEKFKQQEWHRRLNGFWFQNNDNPTYITGLNYYYLCYWKIDIGSPKFRIPDLEKSYFLQYCVDDPYCMGMTEVTKRRFGKSYYAGCFLTEAITRTKMANGGIQSKTQGDAKKFFSKTVVNPFRSLPKIFRPIYDTSLGSNPKSELRFQRPNIRGKKSDENIADDELGGYIDFGSADTMAYDGQKLFVTVQDECYKTVEANIYDRHEVIRYCLLDDEGRIIGKALYTSTVEKLDTDKDGVTDAGKLLWDESDQNKRQENGRTSSGLYRFFMSAKKTRNFDLYGFPDEEKTLKTILADRESVKNNQRALSARIRKEPLTIEEAFSFDSDKCAFNGFNIEERERGLHDTPKFKRSIIFYREINGDVKWRDANGSDTDFCWRITELPMLEIANNHVIKDKLKTPTNTKKFAIAVDSYSNSQGGRKYGSKASAWLGVKLDIANADSTGKAIGHLYGRPKVKEQLHEQVMLCAEFCGCKAWYERQSDDYLSYFRERGKINYLGKDPISTIDPAKREDYEKLYGIGTTPFSLTKQLDMGIAYVENHCEKIDFEELLSNMKIFDPYDRTAYDAVVSFLMLLVVLFEPEPPSQAKNPLVRIV